MKITDIEVHLVNIPLVTGYRWSVGINNGHTKGVIFVRTDEGITGLGELPNPDLLDIVRREYAPLLKGADPLNIDDCSGRCVPEMRALKNTHDLSAIKAFGGLEIALWDIKGKALGTSIADLLGGVSRQEIGFSEYFALRPGSALDPGQHTPTDVARYCADMREKYGSTLFEGKLGVLDLESEIRMVKEIRAAVGADATLRLDANMAWPLNTARHALARLAPFDIANIEDPVAHYFDMRKLRQHSAIPFSSHGPADLRLISELGVPDTLVLNIMQLGGIRETLKLISACEHMGVGFWFYSGDTAIGTAAYMQLAAAVPYLEQPSQSLLRWYVDDIIEQPFLLRANKVSLPAGPGLGISIDDRAFKRCRDRYEKEGPITQIAKDNSNHYARLKMQ